MEIYAEPGDPFLARCLLTVTREQLHIFVSSMGETLEAVDECEFLSRVCVDKDTVRRTLDELNTLVRSLPPE